MTNLRKFTFVFGGLAFFVMVFGFWVSHPHVDSNRNPNSPLPDFQLVAVTPAHFRKVTRQNFLGRPWVADFIFTRCGGPCPFLSSRMSQLQKILPDRVRLVSFTVDPDRDTPGVLQKYARRFSAQGDRWLFLTGPKDSLYGLLRNGFHLAIAEDAGAPEGFRVTHSTRFVLVDSLGRIQGYYDGNDPHSLEALRAEVGKL